MSINKPMNTTLVQMMIFVKKHQLNWWMFITEGR